MTRVELVVQATVESYDADGNLTASRGGQPMKLAAMSPEALALALEGLRQQLVGAWDDTPNGQDTEG